MVKIDYKSDLFGFASTVEKKTFSFRDVCNFHYNKSVVSQDYCENEDGSFCFVEKQEEYREMNDQQFEWLQKHNIYSATKVAYVLLSKFSNECSSYCDEISKDIEIVTKILGHLSSNGVPQEIAGGFLLLMIKHHVLKSRSLVTNLN